MCLVAANRCTVRLYGCAVTLISTVTVDGGAPAVRPHQWGPYEDLVMGAALHTEGHCGRDGSCGTGGRGPARRSATGREAAVQKAVEKAAAPAGCGRIEVERGGCGGDGVARAAVKLRFAGRSLSVIVGGGL